MHLGTPYLCAVWKSNLFFLFEQIQDHITTDFRFQVEGSVANVFLFRFNIQIGGGNSSAKWVDSTHRGWSNTANCDVI